MWPQSMKTSRRFMLFCSNISSPAKVLQGRVEGYRPNSILEGFPGGFCMPYVISSPLNDIHVSQPANALVQN